MLRPESAGHEPMTEFRASTRTASSPHGGVAPLWTGLPGGSGEPLEGANAAPREGQFPNDFGSFQAAPGGWVTRAPIPR